MTAHLIVVRRAFKWPFRVPKACSLAPQGDDRIHRGGLARGDVTRQERNSPEEQRYRSERYRIGGADTVEQVGHESRECQGRDQPRGHSDGGQP